MVETEQESWVGAPRYWCKLVDIYSDKLKANPRSHLYVPLADALLNLGRTTDAIFVLEEGLAMFPNSRSAKIMLAKISYERGKNKIAKKILEEVVSSWPDAWAAVSLLCKIYEEEGDRGAALNASSKLLDYMPDASCAQDLKARYNDLSASEPEPETISLASLPEIAEAEPHYQQCEVPIFEKVKTMARLETLLYRINLLKTQN